MKTCVSAKNRVVTVIDDWSYFCPIFTSFDAIDDLSWLINQLQQNLSFLNTVKYKMNDVAKCYPMTCSQKFDKELALVVITNNFKKHDDDSSRIR